MKFPTPKNKVRLFLTTIFLLGAAVISTPQTAWAHVKWFSRFSFGDEPRTFGEILTPTVIGLVLLSMGVIIGMVLVDRRLDDMSWYGRINRWLAARQPHSVEVMRLAMAAVLLISWASDVILSPELDAISPLFNWLQFIAAILLFFPKLTPFGGLIILFLYLVNVITFGPFYMLDYLHYVGISVYLIVSRSANDRVREIGIPALYASIGFSLIWLGFEKLVYPEWSLFCCSKTHNWRLGCPPNSFYRARLSSKLR